MNDNELMRALFAEGMPTTVIAEKFDLPVSEVHELLGLKRPHMRSVKLYRRFWDAMGERAMSSNEIAKAMRMQNNYVCNYMRKLEERGQVKRVGTTDSRRGFPMAIWQMVRVDEFLVDEPLHQAA